MDVGRLRIETDPLGHKIINNQYVVARKLGQGQFGKVLLAADSRNENKKVAIKTINRIDKSKLITKNYLLHATKIKREIQIMKECQHPNVVQLYSVIDDLKFDKILLVLEYCAYGELEWKNYNHYNEKYYKDDGLTINRILRDVINGLDYLHNTKRIIHRDLKPLNLLISMSKTIKISDFGVSLILENNTPDNEKELGRLLGTPAFFAPELCQFVHLRYLQINLHDKTKQSMNSQESFRLSYQIDLWSLGVILYCLIFHCLPFNGHNEFALFKNIVDEPLKFPKVRNSTLTTTGDLEELKQLKDLITKLLIKDPAERATIEDVKNHPFTTYDISPSKKLEFLNSNRKLLEHLIALAKEPVPDFAKLQLEKDNRKSAKIKNLFRKEKPTENKESKLRNPINSKSLKQDQQEAKPNVKPKFADLEQVDDLLDLYYDDSSSFGSIEEDEVHSRFEPSTFDILESNSPERYNSKDIINDEPLEPLSYTESKQLSQTPSPPKPPPHNLPMLNLNASDATLLPQPQIFSQDGSLGSPQKPFYTNSNTLSPGTPTSTIVTIGAGSPTIFKSMFSPSRRFFSKLRKNDIGKDGKDKFATTTRSSTNTVNSPMGPTVTPTRPTITSLSKDDPNELEMFKPPSLFTPNASRRNSANSSRKNSMSSLINGGGSGLSRITSSSSSLNLNGYLTDDNYSLNSFRNSATSSLKYKIAVDIDENDSSDDSENEGDITITEGAIRKNMSDYIDGLG